MKLEGLHVGSRFGETAGLTFREYCRNVVARVADVVVAFSKRRNPAVGIGYSDGRLLSQNMLPSRPECFWVAA